MSAIVIATRNAAKLAEMRGLLAGAGVEVRGLEDADGAPPVVEDGDSFEANAAKKAESCAEATGRVSVADDSGLVVDALGGGPGVLSARYAGVDGDHAANNAKLLAELRGVPEGRRTARFVCVVAVAAPGRKTAFFRGECEGIVAAEPRGGGGFGYDSLFYSPLIGRTFAEAPGEKSRISHRARALGAFREALSAGRFDEWFRTLGGRGGNGGR